MFDMLLAAWRDITNQDVIHVQAGAILQQREEITKKNKEIRKQADEVSRLRDLYSAAEKEANHQRELYLQASQSDQRRGQEVRQLEEKVGSLTLLIQNHDEKVRQREVLIRDLKADLSAAEKRRVNEVYNMAEANAELEDDNLKKGDLIKRLQEEIEGLETGRATQIQHMSAAHNTLSDKVDELEAQRAHLLAYLEDLESQPIE